MRLTNYFIHKKVKALAGRSDRRQSRFCSLGEARQVLVLFNAEDRETVEPSLATLRNQNKNIQVCAYVSTDTLPEMPSSYLVIHTKTDLDMWYMPKEEVRKKFNACNADILIDLTTGNNYVMQYLLLQHPSLFKVGARSNDLDLYDLTISVTEATDIKHIFDHILFYLQTIRSK